MTKYNETHEWVKIEGKTGTIGISDFAQKELGDLVFVNLPEVGASLKAGDAFCDVESVKAVSDLYSPVTGKITEVNTELESAPELINSDPMGAWICKVEIESEGKLLDEDQYKAFLKDK